MANKTCLEWLKKEESIFEQSILALIGALFATNFVTFSIWGQPYNWRISIGLFIFCILFRIKNHLSEPRMAKFYDDFTDSLTPRGKSVEKITDELYLRLSHLLCLSIVHFYVFLVTFSAYIILDQYFNYAYLKHQINKKPNWGGKKDKVELFKSWVYIGHSETVLILLVVYAISKLNNSFNLITGIFILLLIIIEIIMDWFVLNGDFYLD
jgi:hypothetical protein